MRILVTGGSGFIGTNCVEFLLGAGNAEVINLDNRPPCNVAHKDLWRKCDLLDAPRLKKIVKDFSPTHVVHLAAKCSMDEPSLSVFAANMEGVENMISALKETPSVERVIFTSTLLVCRMGYMPKHDTDYKPSTLYGESKVRGEQIVRAQRNLPFAWTIIRPIGIWGPWGGEPYKNLFQAIQQGWYIHAGNGHYKRNLGYVENSAHQIHKLLLAPREKIDGKTMYLSDEGLIDLYDFANEIQKVLGVKKNRHVPLAIVKFAAKVGDILKAAGWRRVPLTSFKLNNMTTEYSFDLKPITEISAPLPYSYREGIKRTIEWLNSVGELKK